jgi:predicted component of type VI protein secretion system
MAEKFCPVCKNKNASDAEVCAFCGVPFGAEAQAPVTTVPLDTVQPELLLKRSEHLQHLAEYPKNALIMYIMDMDQPLVVPGLRSVVLGRAVTTVTPGLVDLTPYGAADLGVSRQHAQIGFSGTYTLADIGSTNGTRLNQARLVAHKPYALHSGDEVRLGSLRLTIYYHQGEIGGGAAEDVILLTEMPSISGQRPRLTMTYLTDVILPYLTALGDLQKTIDQLQGLQAREVSLNTISALRPELPVGISLSGVSQAILVVKNFINPWRAENAADLSHYLTGQASKTGAEAVLTPAAPHQAGTMILQPAEGDKELRQAAQENLRVRLPRLAQAVAEHLAVLLATEQKWLADGLLPSLRVLALSRLQMVVDKPKTGA